MTEWRVWHTCLDCPPHGMADHTLYGAKECLIKDCTCKGYKPDKTKPIKRIKSTRSIGNPLPQPPL